VLFLAGGNEVRNRVVAPDELCHSTPKIRERHIQGLKSAILADLGRSISVDFSDINFQIGFKRTTEELLSATDERGLALS
jgi:hypothetical protein